MTKSKRHQNLKWLKHALILELIFLCLYFLFAAKPLVNFINTLFDLTLASLCLAAAYDLFQDLKRATLDTDTSFLFLLGSLFAIIYGFFQFDGSQLLTSLEKFSFSTTFTLNLDYLGHLLFSTIIMLSGVYFLTVYLKFKWQQRTSD